MKPGDEIYVHWMEQEWRRAVLVEPQGPKRWRVRFGKSKSNIDYPTHMIRTIEEHTPHLLVQ